MAPPVRPVSERFWEKVDRSGGRDACWPYMGAIRGPEGYGAFWIGGKHHIASRVALELALGRPLVRGEDACHGCDNPICCNPAHLFAAPHRSNIADKVAKRRQAVGERVGSSKLTADQVREARATFSGRRGETKELAAHYGVAETTMSQILTGKWWRHVL